MKVLVTGGLGYVGSVLVPHLAKKHQVRVYDSMLFGNSIEGTPNVEFVKGDILDRQAVSKAVNGQDALIHLAGVVTDELVDMNPAYAKKVNEEATESLAGLAYQAGVTRLIYASSSSVYGSQAEPCTEESPTKPETVYAETKLAAERICLSYAGLHMVATAVRSATCCGPAPRMRLDTIVNVFSKQAWFDGKITVFDGTQYRSNIHVQDVAELYGLLLEAPADKVNGQVFNAVREYGSALSIAQQVANIITLFGKHVIIDVDHTKKDARQYRMSGDKALRVLGWRPARSVARAVEDNFRWFAHGAVHDPNDAIWYNTRRMKDVVTKG